MWIYNFGVRQIALIAWMFDAAWSKVMPHVAFLCEGPPQWRKSKSSGTSCLGNENKRGAISYNCISGVARMIFLFSFFFFFCMSNDREGGFKQMHNSTIAFKITTLTSTIWKKEQEINARALAQEFGAVATIDKNGLRVDSYGEKVGTKHFIQVFNRNFNMQMSNVSFVNSHTRRLVLPIFFKVATSAILLAGAACCAIGSKKHSWDNLWSTASNDIRSIKSQLK